MPKKSGPEIIRESIAISVAAIGGWMVFSGMTGLFGLDKLTDVWSILIGLGIIVLTTRLGLRK